jgi:hypothetical protein
MRLRALPLADVWALCSFTQKGSYMPLVPIRASNVYVFSGKDMFIYFEQERAPC